MSSLLINQRLFWVGASLLLILGFVSVNVLRLQVIEPKKGTEQLKLPYTKKTKITAHRGIIYDRNSEVLARDLIFKDLIVDRYHLKNTKFSSLALAFDFLSQDPDFASFSERQKINLTKKRARELRKDRSESKLFKSYVELISRKLGGYLGVKASKFESQLIESKSSDIALMKKLPADESELLEDYLRVNKIRGVYLRPALLRWYPGANLASHIIGYVDHKYVGKSGVEKILQNTLKGHNGFELVGTDSKGRFIPNRNGEKQDAIDGLNVKLSIDLGIQSIVEEELKAAVNEYKAEKGTVIVVDPKTGGVLALANYPNFDLNQKWKAAKNSFNYAIQGVYEPGSTLKVVGVSASLNEGYSKIGRKIFCHLGNYKKANIQINDYKAFNYLSVEEIIAKSSNIGAYLLAKELGPQRYYEYLARYGFLQESGFVLLGENKGNITSIDNPVNFSRLSYGYAIGVTPLQMVMAYAAIANDGVLMKPNLVLNKMDSRGNVLEKYSPQKVRKILSTDVALKMRHMLSQATSPQGTASRARVDGFEVAGKTGTSRKYTPSVGYEEGKYTVSFVGMMPAAEPKFVCLVVIDEPKTKKIKPYGGTMASPTFSKIANRLASHMGLSSKFASRVQLNR